MPDVPIWWLCIMCEPTMQSADAHMMKVCRHATAGSPCLGQAGVTLHVRCCRW